MIIQNSFVSPREHFELAVLFEDKFIGRVGGSVKRNNDDGTARDTPHADIWFSFLPETSGKGFATEAMKAFIPLLGSPVRLEIECDPRNTGSWKLAERLGFEKISLTEDAFECKGEMVGSLVYEKDA
jgi:RimJ/RimL family protein N-acetyltransferase